MMSLRLYVEMKQNQFAKAYIKKKQKKNHQQLIKNEE